MRRDGAAREETGVGVKLGKTVARLPLHSASSVLASSFWEVDARSAECKTTVSQATLNTIRVTQLTFSTKTVWKTALCALEGSHAEFLALDAKMSHRSLVTWGKACAGVGDLDELACRDVGGDEEEAGGRGESLGGASIGSFASVEGRATLLDSGDAICDCDGSSPDTSIHA